ncbi:telomere zinc finger-associated protein [Anarrhichthys ocellatus]|uniref:telomere zinc finger-associated protein n=1 Tax=Anarrhichthys ocellatus TaxID=433405 RepID=UPI0012EE8F3A|nr:telomere zinc finger-associated protein [Anarrhichthys ocellatus]XP_031701588.1 telomere zinc finger-associated protein [Anarrhichthys ocellatus]XP_031701590.1 telomere zinc finger-associated protein [Anarrhichthys ocellatus]XP_031701591.1 telomere zinc finger-associated protein [Anarrhichthys ocellatus]XP_031701592.1 telomere zinc finger-associated protein [Anarrhichthys ocellatus]
MPAAESNHALRVLSSLNQQRAVGRFCDAVLNVGDRVVHLAHRNILACFSELFQQSNMPTAPCTEFCLQECPTDGLELLLNFVYTGELKLDPDNLEKVQHAAASLCVPEALTLCNQFKETSVDPVPLKRKRGRPRKSTSDTTPYSSVKEENLLTITKDECSLDTATANCSMAATTTTTRSGRVVKGPRRLVTVEGPTTDFTAPEKVSKKALLIPIETESGDDVEGNRNPDHPTGETEITDLQIDINDNGVSQVLEEEEEEEDDVGDFEGIPEDTDEEYVPVEEPLSSAPSTSKARKCKVQSKMDQNKNSEAMEEDSKKDSVQCPICDKSFKSKYYLKVHNRRHTGERPFGCLKCGKRYFRKENLLLHEIRDCAKVQTYTCVTCSSTFNGKEALRLHVVSHTGNMPHKCSICPEQFMHKKNLTIHMMKVHGYPKPHPCPQCPKTFLTRSELRVHEAAKHRGEKPFVCEECGHRASSRNGLQMHIKAIHRNERPFVCNICGHAFSQKNNLNMHLRIHSGERPYQCHLCGKTFRTQASLDKHHRTHTGERPFSCDVCEQRFTEKGALIRHKASKHEEGRPHCCHICGKTFKAREQLRVHLRRHKGMRKFECIDCGYKFTRQAHLRRHIQIHKRTENYNPRQRKLRNVIVQEVDGESPGENEATKEVQDALIAEETTDEQESTNAEPDSGTGLTSSCIVGVMIESSSVVMEAVVSNQNLGHVEAAESFSVPDVLQQTQLVTEAYESTMDMEEMVENIPETKT